MKKLISWFKSFFNSNTSDLFESKPPIDDYEYQDLLSKREKELDRILDKINKHGIETLTTEERSFLKKMKN